jgi:VanZ family protein
MLPLRFARNWQIASLVLLLAILLAALLPAVWFLPEKAKLINWFGGVDKWAHAAAFAFLTVWFAGLYPRSAYWRIAVGMLAYGVLIELCQALISYRSAEWPDLGADVIGIAAGLSLALFGAGRWCLVAENWYVERKAVERDG